MAMVQFVQQYPELVVADATHRYVARAYAAPRADGGWDAWFLFLPFGHGLPLATDRETTQSTLPGVKYWADAITTVDMQDALRRARASWPSALLGNRLHQAEQDALARTAAVTCVSTGAEQ